MQFRFIKTKLHLKVQLFTYIKFMFISVSECVFIESLAIGSWNHRCTVLLNRSVWAWILNIQMGPPGPLYD
jgi:hypothetical protein